jgi:hypothetical protein
MPEWRLLSRRRRHAAAGRLVLALGAASFAAHARRCGWARLDRADVVDAPVCAFFVLAWGSSALAALSVWQLVTASRSDGPDDGEVDNARGVPQLASGTTKPGHSAAAAEGFASYAAAALLVVGGAAASYSGVFLETLLAVHEAPLVVEGAYGILCTGGGMVRPSVRARSC